MCRSSEREKARNRALKNKHLKMWQQRNSQYWSVQSLSCVWLFVTWWTAACQASLSFTISQNRSYLYLCSLVLTHSSSFTYFFSTSPFISLPGWPIVLVSSKFTIIKSVFFVPILSPCPSQSTLLQESLLHYTPCTTTRKPSGHPRLLICLLPVQNNLNTVQNT